jgi:hypothetical protein
MTSSVLLGLLVLAGAAVLGAQTPTDARPAPNLENPWEIAPVLEAISSHAGRLEAALDKLNPQEWLAKGASDTYTAQLESSKQQARAVGSEAWALAGNPEKLSSALQVLFRIQGLDTMVASLEEAVRKYQSPADAQALMSLMAQDGANQDRLQRYVVNLAAAREQDLAVMDREAQRCRAMVTQPETPTRTRRK